MASAALHYPRVGFWRFSPRDAILVTLAAIHAVLLTVWPAIPLIALGVWWNSNTVAHNFIHRPFFRSAAVNRLFSAALSVLLGIPQAVWRDRHLAHHAGIKWRLRLSPRLVTETALVV
ncbi:MAG TPA: fatty acid desaturase, partial [Chthoniobacterales bacterium]